LRFFGCQVDLAQSSLEKLPVATDRGSLLFGIEQLSLAGIFDNEMILVNAT
jgi:hypothetical protein